MRLLTDLRRRISNWRVLNSTRRDRWWICLWVDDERPAPPGWYHAVNVEEAVEVLRQNVVRDWSLDHDLGAGGEVHDLVKWLARELHENGLNFWPTLSPTVHSQDPVGRVSIQETVEQYGPYDFSYRRYRR